MPEPFPPRTFSWTRRAEGLDSIRLILAGEPDLAVVEPFESAVADAQADPCRI
jgi:hypothetical protein